MRQFIKKLLSLEAASSILLMLAAALALVAANTPLAPYYLVLQSPVSTLIINDGLMAIFFLVIGIEIKHELVEGSLSTRAQAILPVVAALGGVILPAVIYSWFNWGAPTMRGWAIPSATDIAFSLGVLSFFGKRVPVSLRIFLMAVAIIDDLAAIIIIATFYTSSLDYMALLVAAGCTWLLYMYSRKQVSRLLPYLFAGGALWASMLASGVHPTIAGVLLGLLMPLQGGKKLVGYLDKWVAFGIVPLFAFANAGIALAGLSFGALAHPVAQGIILGLLIGKPTGIFISTWLLVRFGFSTLPPDTNWGQFFAVAMIAGIGFTMSLFIGALAFTTDELMHYTRIGVVIGSLASAVAGTISLMLSVARKKDAQ